jgi:hypothetical protein
MHQLFKIIAVIFLFPVMAFAMDFGGDVSGGGYVIVCKDPATGVETTELLDYFEARYTLKDYQLMNLAEIKGNTSFDKARFIIKDRLYAYTTQFSKKLIDTISAFEKNEMNFIKRGVITDIDDARTPIDPDSNCYKSQIAVQFKNPAPRQYRVLVDNKAWNELDERTKIGLLIHEALYKIALEQGHTNSNKVRMISAVLVSIDFDPIEIFEVLKYANIEGCMDIPVDFVSEDGLESTLFVPVKISSFKYLDKARVGTLCEDFSAEKFLGKGSLVLRAGSEVYINDSENLKNVEFRKIVVSPDETHNNYWSDGIYRYTGTLKFHTTSPYHLFEATYSDQQVEPSSKTIALDVCLDRYYVDGILRECNKAVGSFEFFGKSFELAYYLLDFGESTYAMLKSEIKHIPLLGTTLSFSPTVGLVKGKINLYYQGVTRKVNFKGSQMTIIKDTAFEFSEDGELLDIRLPTPNQQ